VRIGFILLLLRDTFSSFHQPTETDVNPVPSPPPPNCAALWPL
jgi:hypothetical protein